jgi:hypothetical protein
MTPVKEIVVNNKIKYKYGCLRENMAKTCIGCRQLPFSANSRVMKGKMFVCQDILQQTQEKIRDHHPITKTTG